jgi:acyl carrier protein
MNRDKILQAIFHAIGRTNELREPNQRIACSEDAGLFGSEGGLDSMDLVSLVLDLEEAINSASGIRLVLADERAMARRHSPFRNVRSLADYVQERLEEEGLCVHDPSS